MIERARDYGGNKLLQKDIEYGRMVVLCTGSIQEGKIGRIQKGVEGKRRGGRAGLSRKNRKANYQTLIMY